MRNLLALVGLLVVGFAAVGWYCGWYKLSVNKGGDGSMQIQTEVDTKKVVDDSSAFFQKMGQVVGERGKEKGAQPAAPASPPGPVGPQTPATGTTDRNDFTGGWFTTPPQPVRPRGSSRGG